MTFLNVKILATSRKKLPEQFNFFLQLDLLVHLQFFIVYHFYTYVYENFFSFPFVLDVNFFLINSFYYFVTVKIIGADDCPTLDRFIRNIVISGSEHCRVISLFCVGLTHSVLEFSVDNLNFVNKTQIRTIKTKRHICIKTHNPHSIIHISHNKFSIIHDIFPFQFNLLFHYQFPKKTIVV